MGFVPLAFRTGSERKSRVHIFWQKRIRSGDATTPWWFPSQTSGGSIREDRLVLPIPPGTHWSDAKPLVLPGAGDCGLRSSDCGGKELETAKPVRKRPASSANPKSALRTPQSLPPTPAPKNRLWFAPPAPPAPAVTEQVTKVKRPPRVKQKNDPRYVAAARELKDRWLEHVNTGQYLPTANAKYEIGRAITTEPVNAVLMLPAA
jgi:hypothetical protein